MAATRPRNAALAALTGAALGLPGLSAEAATAVAEAQGNVQYGHYEESSDRMKVDTYHGDFVLPVNDHVEFTFSVDRDTYSGASPAYNIPATMANQVQYSDQGVKVKDVISSASGGVTAAGLTVLGGLNTYKKFIDAGAAAEAAFRAQNPEPSSGSSSSKPGTVSNVTLGFQDMIAGAYFGKANELPGKGGACPNAMPCYSESGMIVGTVPVPGIPAVADLSHIHKAEEAGGNVAAGYHADSGGIYVRAKDGSPFNLQSMYVNAGIASYNQNKNLVLEILGFNSANNPGVSSGGASGQGGRNDYSTAVAYQTVPNGTVNTVALNSQFKNINSFWIHYQGYPSLPKDGTVFKMTLDNVKLGGVSDVVVKTPEQVAWEKELNKQVTVAQYRALLNTRVPPNTQTIQRMQYQPLETRTMPVFGVKYYLDNTLLALSGGYSDEPDFKSNFGSVNLTREFNDKHTTVTAGYSLTSNNVYRNGDTAAHTDHHATDPSHNPTNYSPLNETNTFQGFNLGITQVIDKNTLLQLSGVYTNQGGYLANPYKLVYVRGEITPEEYYQLYNATAPGQINWKSITNLEVVGADLFRETRPGQRNMGSVSVGVNRHIPSLEASLNMDYRFFSDDWGINSHTFEARWFQPLGHGITIAPNIRYYSQSQAYFYAPYFLGPRADGFYSSDYRLSGYGALSGGITFSKSFSKGISLQAGFEYYTHQGALKLGGSGEDKFADFDYYVVHAGLNFNLSSPGKPSGDHSHHHHHYHAPLPAGVMFGHMMDKTNDIMLGFRYMYGNQSGDMLHGADSVRNSTVAGLGCGLWGCVSRPTDMTMNMYMFDVMYAPTDWLNLMVMPQVLDMRMSLATLPGALAEDEHGGGHKSSGMGDTIMMALGKLYDDGTHHAHVGIGFSAPTGDVDVTMDGRPGGVLQDYGMQLGSGTWDFKPNLTYTGHQDKLSWGMQLSGVVRMEGRNSSGYVLGDMFQSTAWGSYSFYDWLSASVRGVYTLQGAIGGAFNQAHSTSATVDYPSNYGGNFWDVGFGVHLAAPPGPFEGHTMSVEWLQPVSDNFNGYQLQRTGTLAATWTYMF